MKLSLALMISLAFLSHGSPVESSAEVSEAAPEALDKRDKWCFVTEENVKCMEGANTGYKLVRRIQPNQRFGVSCKAYGGTVGGSK
jgi:hypothetical protein